MDSDERKRAPPDADFASEFAGRIENEPADERVYRVALGLTGPTRVAEVASRADCSKNAARRHLKRLADIGVLAHVSEQPDTFERNESYFEWRRLNRLSDLSDEEYTERFGELLAEDEAYREEYNVDDPDALEPLDYGKYGDAERVWLDLTNWRAIRQEIRDLRRIKHKDTAGTGLP
jgi:hypothetical protein